TSTTQPDDAGHVPPNKVIGKCENVVAKTATKLAAAIVVCHVRAAQAAFKGRTPVDEDGCEGAARATYDAATRKRSGCSPCLDTAALATLADGIAATLDARNAALYCAGTQTIGGDDSGFVPPIKATLTCADRAAKNLARLMT